MSRLSRRDFARAATVAAGAALLPRSAAAQTAREGGPARDAASGAAPTKLGGAAQAEADARFAAIVARWGSRLTAQDRAVVAALVADMQAPLEALRAASLDVTDEPALQFRAPRKKH